MVYYEDCCLDYPKVDMFNGRMAGYSPNGPMYSSTTSQPLVNTYSNQSLPTDSYMTSEGFYQDNNYRPYTWQQSSVKDDTGYQSCWQYSPTANQTYKVSTQAQEYYGPVVQNQYPPCAMMTQQPLVQHNEQSNPTEGSSILQKERQQQSYQWITNASLPNSGKTRTKDKYRVVYSDHQRLELEKEFHYSRYITIRRKAELAANLSLSERQVKIWFQNRRAKERKMSKKKGDIESRNKMDAAGSPSASSCDEMEISQPLKQEV